MGLASSVGIANRNGLDGPGIESQYERFFRTLGPNQPQWVGGIDDPPPPKEGVELYLYSPSGPLWPVIGCTLLYLLSVLV